MKKVLSCVFVFILTMSVFLVGCKPETMTTTLTTTKTVTPAAQTITKTPGAITVTETKTVTTSLPTTTSLTSETSATTGDTSDIVIDVNFEDDLDLRLKVCMLDYNITSNGIVIEGAIENIGKDHGVHVVVLCQYYNGDTLLGTSDPVDILFGTVGFGSFTFEYSISNPSDIDRCVITLSIQDS